MPSQFQQRFKERLSNAWDQFRGFPGRLMGWWERFLGRSKPTSEPEESLYRAVLLTDDADLPKIIPTMSVFIIGVPGNEWLAAMTCPCGCQSTLLLNLLPDEMPNWKFSVAPDGAVTLSPSVWRQIGCRSHFFVRSGKIKWC